MNPLWWMIAAGVLTSVAATGVGGAAVHPEIVLGMAGPLAATGATWVLAERTFRAAPGQLTGVMLAALLAKMVFFAGYVAIMLRVVGLRPTPFVVSFTCYFIGLYAMEALFLSRLFGGAMKPSER